MYLAELASGRETLIETGIPDLDYSLGGGVALGEMVIIAARPSHGKSAVALQMAHHMSSNGLPVVMVSEEMSALALGKRALQYLTDTPEEHWKVRLEDVASDIESHFKKREDIQIVEACGPVDRACEEIEKSVLESKTKVAVVDYAQLLTAKGKGRYEQITAVSQQLRMLASRLQIVVIVLAQLNREIENRKKFVPMMSDIKETGQLEQDADVIVFGVWPHRIDATNDPKKYLFFVCKNRNRGILSGAFECQFNPSRQKLTATQIPVESLPSYEAAFESDDEEWMNR
jgi:replicative DNA helicase